VNGPDFGSYRTSGFTINDVQFPGSAPQLLCMKQAPQFQKLIHQDSNDNGVRHCHIKKCSCYEHDIPALKHS
jgi:hypothetical protein